VRVLILTLFGAHILVSMLKWESSTGNYTCLCPVDRSQRGAAREKESSLVGVEPTKAWPPLYSLN